MRLATIFKQFFLRTTFKKAVTLLAVFVFLFFITATNIFAAQVLYVSNGNFTVPAGVNQVTISISGGGGGGGSLSSSGAGSDGGTSSFGTLLTAIGGKGGKNGDANSGGQGGLAGGIGGNNGNAGSNSGFGGKGGNSLFGTGGQANADLFTSASNGGGYGSGGGGGFDGGGGGGAQAYNNTVISVTPGQVIPITIGNGGAGSTGDSSFFASGGNGASGFVQINYTPDTTAPAITLTGSSSLTIQVGTAYIDAGATANDNFDGNITGSITATSTVNSSLIGTYTVTYNVSDSSGNAATPVIRTVTVIDTVSPTNPIVTSPTHATNTVTSNTSIIFNWSTSTDAGGLAGYSFVLDTLSGTIPDTATDTLLTTTTQTLNIGSTYYFHVKALDVSGNSSATSHIGPFIITNSAVSITNSSVNGTYYSSLFPSIASSSAFGINGTSTIFNSTTTLV